MRCAREACQEKEDRIDGYCSVYCRDVDEAWLEVARVKEERDEYHKRYHHVCAKSREAIIESLGEGLEAVEAERDSLKKKSQKQTERILYLQLVLADLERRHPEEKQFILDMVYREDNEDERAN